MGFPRRADRDVYQEVTDKLIAAIEAGAGKWQMPWHRTGGFAGSASGLPINTKGRPYRGINVPLLWAEAAAKGYSSHVWGTFDAFKNAGKGYWRQGERPCVRKGEKATYIVFWGRFTPKAKPGEKPEDVKPILFAKLYPVFNADQVDNFTPAKTGESINLPPAGPARDAYAESFFAAQNVTTKHGGDRAYYMPALDYIQMPTIEQFRETSGYYGTLGHEQVHATGNPNRLDRDLTGRFKSESYAAEELIAELGAAFLCAMLGIDNEPRPDHAAYVQSWLRVLHDDKKAIFTAASAAQKAVDYMMAKAGAVAENDDDEASAPSGAYGEPAAPVQPDPLPIAA